MMENILNYLNPIKRLGKRKYSYFFPFLTITVVFIIIELVVYYVLHDPMAVGTLAIFIPVALIIYFAFRDGLKGGFVSVVLTILYYLYIIYTRNYKGEGLKSGLETTLSLAALYSALAGIIGWLRQTIDKFIERESDERRRFQAIVQQLPVGVIVADKDKRIDFVNKKADEILGVKIPTGFQLGKESLVKVINGNSISSQSILMRTLTSGKSIINEEFAIEKEGGKKIFIEASASPIRNKHGKVMAAVVIVNDVTGQKEMERRKDDFVNMASHELKTPITSMKLYLDALIKNNKKYDPEKANKMIKIVRTQTERLQKLVSDMLDVSRLQTGKLSFQKEKINLSKLVEEGVEELRSVSAERNINFSGKTAVMVDADQFRIHQVVTNLVTNAIKYSPEGGSIEVKVRKDVTKGIVSVADQGIGIDKNQQKKIFDRLYQVMDYKEKTFPGLGMGLYISKEIIRRHKGQIWVESEKGKGSTFYFSLPISS